LGVHSDILPKGIKSLSGIDLLRSWIYTADYLKDISELLPVRVILKRL